MCNAHPAMRLLQRTSSRTESMRTVPVASVDLMRGFSMHLRDGVARRENGSNTRCVMLGAVFARPCSHEPHPPATRPSCTSQRRHVATATLQMRRGVAVGRPSPDTARWNRETSHGPPPAGPARPAPPAGATPRVTPRAIPCRHVAVLGLCSALNVYFYAVARTGTTGCFCSESAEARGAPTSRGGASGTSGRVPRDLEEAAAAAA